MMADAGGTLSSMALRHDEGIVLRSYPFGEADRVVVLLSPRRGKLRTVAKGVRKTTSRFGGRLEPFTHVELVVYEGRNLDVITQVEVVEAFPRLRRDLDRVVVASTMVEAADAVVQEHEPSTALFGVVRKGLQVLDRTGPLHPDLIAAFLLQLARVAGMAPSLDRCVDCRRPASDRFSFVAGGVVCGSCRTEGAVRLREGLTDYLARLAYTDLDDLPPPVSGIAGEAIGVARRFAEHHFDRRLASLVVLQA